MFQAKQKEIESQISTEMAAVQQELESAIQQADPASQSVIDRVVQAAVAQVGGNGGTSNQWRSVTVPAGQSLLGSVGCQVILRSGSASCYSGMVDLSSGGKILHGDSVAQNNLYLVGTEGCGFTATAECTALVCGSAAVQ